MAKMDLNELKISVTWHLLQYFLLIEIIVLTRVIISPEVWVLLFLDQYNSLFVGVKYFVYVVSTSILRLVSINIFYIEPV